MQEFRHLLLSNDRCQECLRDNLLTDQIIHILNIPQIQTLKEFCDQLRKSTDTLSEDDGQYLKVQRLLEFVEVPTNYKPARTSSDLPSNTWDYR